jgi:proteic killer suppression protein
LELAFDSRTLRTICESETHAKDELGVAVAAMLKHRLADLRAATSVKDLVAGRLRLLEDTGDPCMALDLCEGYRMVFCANHARNPVAPTGGLDWPRVSRVKIMRIEKDNA